ncbi:MAG: lamin tail domain-containing protein [Candidatus Saccharibacteria bacterium]|nr:lamin tail domain-containing protein [Candidatus Saccharibacteria bacterium]
MNKRWVWALVLGFVLPLFWAAGAVAEDSPATETLILISEFQNRGTVDDGEDAGSVVGTHEFIELYNPHNETVSLDGWELEFANEKGTTTRSIVLFEDDSDADVGYEIQPDGFFVVSYESYLPEANFLLDSRTASGYLNYHDGTIRLFDNDGELVDMVGYGDPEHYLTSPAGAPQPDQSLIRCFGQDGLIVDTGNNALDFTINEIPMPGAGLECPLPEPDPEPDDEEEPEEQSGEKPEDEPDDDLSQKVDKELDTDQETAPEDDINICEGVVISEIGANLDEQFIELHNLTNQEAELDGCQLQTNRNDNTYVFADEVVEPHDYLTIQIANTELTLTKTTTGTVYVLSSDGQEEVDAQKYSDLRPETSWAWFGDDDWRQTYELTLGQENKYQEYADCKEGKERNPDTGRCRNIVSSTSELKPCDSDQERNPETNRCRKIDSGSSLVPCRPGQERNPETNRCRSVTSSTRQLVPCKPHQERNPETNRCRNINQTSGLKPCSPGQERNPETNRCRNVAAAMTELPEMNVRDVTTVARPTPLSWWFAGFMVALAAGYGVWEWRYDIANLKERFTKKQPIDSS